MLFHVNMIYLSKQAERNIEKIIAKSRRRNKIDTGLSDFSFMSARMKDAIVL